jgi:hypothetical protein
MALTENQSPCRGAGKLDLGRAIAVRVEWQDLSETRLSSNADFAQAKRLCWHLRKSNDGEFMNFSQALIEFKAGQRIARQGWNGKGMWLSMSLGSKALPSEEFWPPHNRDDIDLDGPFAASLERSIDSVVVWEPDQARVDPRMKLERVIATIRRCYRTEARFGPIEVWRRFK